MCASWAHPGGVGGGKRPRGGEGRCRRGREWKYKKKKETGAEALIEKLPKILGKDVRVVHAPCMGACDHAPAVAVGHMQTVKATPDKVAAAVKANPHPHAWKPKVDFAAYQKDGGYSLLKDCLAA